MSRSHYSQRLLWHGMLVFILGLVSGMVMIAPVAVYENLRMALSSHLVGVTAGMFLLLVGLVWPRMGLKEPIDAASFWMVLYGAYGNWLATSLGALFGTGSFTAVAGAGYEGAAWQEALVAGILSTSGTTMLAACAIFLWGLRARGDEASD